MRKRAWLGLGMSAAVLIALIAVLVAASTAWGLPLTARNASSTASQVSSSVASAPSSGQTVRSPRPAQSGQASAAPTTPSTATSPSHPRPGAQTPHTTAGTTSAPSTSGTPTKASTTHKAIFYPSQAAWKQAQQAQAKASGSLHAASANDLLYLNGPVQRTPTIYLIFWGPSWASGGSDNGTAQLVESYFNDLGGTSFQNILTQYYDGTGPISNVENFSAANVYFDTSTPPTDQSCGTGYPSIENIDVQTEVSNAIAARGWPTEYANDLFLLYTPNGDYINEALDSSYADCNAPAPSGDWCAETSVGLYELQNSQNYQLNFAAVPYPGSGCQVPSSPNNNLAGDSLINLSSYDAFDVASDPDRPYGWTGDAYDVNGDDEISSPCYWTFPSTNNGETMLKNGGVFEVQEEYSNASSSCVNSYTSPAQTPPLISNTEGIDPTSAPVGASVTIVGAYFTGATSVTFNGTSASFTVNGFGEIDATVPSGATSGPVVVTTAQGTSAPSAFTVTQPLATAALTNGGFEGVDSLTGSLSGWTTSGTTSVSTVAYAGRYSAMLGATTATNGDSSISQTFGVSATGEVDFAYEVNCPGSVSDEWATATIFDHTTGQTTTVLTPTCSTGQGWQFGLANLSEMVNHVVTLTLTNHDDNNASDPTYTYFDNVSLYYDQGYVVENPSFEGIGNASGMILDNQPGSLDGWTTTGTVSVETTAIHAGHWAAEVGASTPTNGDSTLSQTLYLDGRADPYPIALSFWYHMSCSGTVSSDWDTAILHDTFTNKTVTILPPTCTNTGAWTEVTASLDGMAGDNVTLTFTNHDASGTGANGTYAYFDDVNVG